jgi:hypothetical protein
VADGPLLRSGKRKRGLTGVVGHAQRYVSTEVGASPRLSLVLGKDVRMVISASDFFYIAALARHRFATIVRRFALVPAFALASSMF